MASTRRPRYSVTSPAPDCGASLLSDGPFLKRRELARLFNICERHTYELEEEGLERVEFGSAVRFTPQHIAAFVASRTCRIKTPSSVSKEPPTPVAGSSVSRKIRGRTRLGDVLRDSSDDAIAPRLAAEAKERIIRRKGPRS